MFMGEAVDQNINLLRGGGGIAKKKFFGSPLLDRGIIENLIFFAQKQ